MVTAHARERHWYIWGKLKGRVEGMDERKKKMEDGEGKEDIYEREIYSV